MNTERVALVTGAYGKIGKAIAEIIALNDNIKVVLIGRNETKLVETVSEIKRITLNQQISYEVVDLSSKQSIEELSQKWIGPLHILINNAATTPRQRLESAEGIEMQFATNVLGYMWMMKTMGKHMIGVHNARIVNVASYWTGGLDLNDVEFKNRHYNNDEAYRQSKQADRMLSFAYSQLLKKNGIAVNSCHPGDVNSTLSNNLGFGGHETPRQGADTPSWLAISDQVTGKTGLYFEHKREVSCRFSSNKKQVQQLLELCESY